MTAGNHTHPQSKDRLVTQGWKWGRTRSSGTSVSLTRSETVELEPLLGVQGNLVF